MTREKAQSIVAIANRPTSRLFVEWARVLQEPDGTCSVVIEPVYGEQRVYSDAQQAGSALSSLLAEVSKACDLYFTLSEDGTLVRCDREEYLKDAPNRAKTLVKIECSSEIKASVGFLGHVWAVTSMDGEMKLWNAGFCKTAKNQHFGATAFETQNQAMVFVARFIELECPEPGSILWGQFMREFH